MTQAEPDVIIILVGNMKDREAQREVPVSEARDFQRANNIPFFLETSAKTGQNVETVFQMAAKILYEDYKDRIVELVSPTFSQISQMISNFMLLLTMLTLVSVNFS